MKPRIPHPLRDPACNLCDIIKYGYFHQLRLLICSGVPLECRDACRRTPIMLCAFMEPETWGVGTARTLIESGVRLDGKDKFGRNVLHYACIYERCGLMHVLLKAIDFDLNQSDKLGNTALHYAAMSGNGAVTQLISSFFIRYKITPGKLNKNGLSAFEEASRLGNTSCARIIDDDGRKGSATGRELHFDNLVSSGVVSTQNSLMPANGTHLTVNYRPSPRPASATFLTRRGSAASFASMDERRSSCSYRSRSNISRRGSHRSRQSPLLAMGIKREEDVVYCADEKDFRNTADFVFKLLHLPFDMHEWNPIQNLDSTNRNNAWPDTGSTTQTQAAPICSRPDWRKELKSLFKVYESQCSSSWRAAPKPPSIATEDQEKVENEEEERGKKSRRHSNHARPGVAGKEQAAVPDLRRRSSTTRVRRLSSVHGTLGKISVQGLVDGNVDTSPETINGAVASSNKKRGPEKEMNSSGRPENITNRTGIRRPSLEPSCPSSPCTSPPPPNNVTNGQAQPGQRSDDISEKNNENNDAKVHIKPDNGSSHNRFDQAKMKNHEKTNLIRRPSQDDDSDNLMENSKVNFKEKRAAAIDKRNGAIGIQMKVPQVKESLVPDCGFNNDTEIAVTLDTTRLWVQNPYEGNDDDELSEDDEGGDSDGY